MRPRPQPELLGQIGLETQSRTVQQNHLYELTQAKDQLKNKHKQLNIQDIRINLTVRCSILTGPNIYIILTMLVMMVVGMAMTMTMTTNDINIIAIVITIFLISQAPSQRQPVPPVFTVYSQQHSYCNKNLKTTQNEECPKHPCLTVQSLPLKTHGSIQCDRQ